jgi:ectoine hydroxylase-related dioxygenase (phytanoyl-CoA dioxygenase family)
VSIKDSDSQFELKELQSANEFLDDAQQIRAFAREQGYIFCRGLLPASDVDAVQIDILEIARRHDLMADEASPMDMQTKPGLPIFEMDTPEWLCFYREVLCLRSLNALPATPRMYEIASTLIEEPVFHHARVNVRFFANFPFQFASPPHRDFTWIGGTESVWTSWIPLGNIDFRLGGLQIIPGSHLRYYATRGNDESEGIAIPEHELWHTAPQYCLGDVVFFHSRTVHSGGGNFRPDRLRASLECRYQPISHPVRSDVMEPHWKQLGLLTWEELYRTWPKDDPLRYYWRDLPLKFVSETEGTHQQNLRKRYLYNLLRLKSVRP